MSTPNPKRPCYDISSSIQNPNSQNHLDSMLPDSPSFSLSSLKQVLGKVISSASETSDEDSVHDRLIDRTLYNSNFWPLPHDLTVKIFYMLDTKSRIRAAACCNMWRKCYKEPFLHTHIDLTTKNATHLNHQVVCAVIHRAGDEIRTLKLGRVSRTVIPTLTRSFLNGYLLRSLHLYHLYNTSTNSLCNLLSVCPNLTDLKIRIFDEGHFLERIVKSLTKTHRFIENLFIEYRSISSVSGLSSSTVEAFVTSCPKLSSLTLIGFRLEEETTRDLAMGFPKLNYMNLSRTPGITGRFLSHRDNNNNNNSPLKTLILRDCFSLNVEKIIQFLNSLITENSYYRFISHIDVSSESGLACNGAKGTSIPKALLRKLKQERSDVTIVEEST